MAAARVAVSGEEAAIVAALTARLRREEPELGHLVAAIGFKRALVERFGLEEAFHLARGPLNVPGLDRLRPRRVVPLLEAARRAPVYRELWAGGGTFVHPAPRVIGDGDHAEQRGIGRTAYLACLEDAAVRGRSSVVLAGDAVLVDCEHDELTRFPDHPEFDPGVLYAEEDTYWTMEAAAPLEVEEAFLLAGSHANDFGHWLTEYLPRLAIALMAGLPEVPILVDEHMPRTHVESLELFVPGRQIVVLPHLAPCRVRRLWCAPNPVYRGYYPTHTDEVWLAMVPDPHRFAPTIRALEERAAPALGKDTGDRRVYLARRPERRKRLVNHIEIEAAARERGFRVVHPEDLPFADQLRLVHHARHLVAPDGSNSLLAYFAPPGAELCILNNPFTYPLVELNGLLAALDVGYTVLTGPLHGPVLEDPFWTDYTIDAGRFRRFLDGWLGGA